MIKPWQSLLVLISLGILLGLVFWSMQPETQPEVWETDCQYQWVEGPSGKTLVCR